MWSLRSLRLLCIFRLLHLDAVEGWMVDSSDGNVIVGQDLGNPSLGGPQLPR
jgi:hypothetical protein